MRISCAPWTTLLGNRRGMRHLVRSGFTIIEVMIATAIFMMVIAAIYSTWMAILRGSKAGLEAAANAQRARIALRTIQDALLSAVVFPENRDYYPFFLEKDGEFPRLTFSARLPSTFPGVGRFSGNIMRRVQFAVEGGDNGKNELVMRQMPVLAIQDEEFEPYKLVLSQDVTLFNLSFLNPRSGKFEEEWTGAATNTLPRLVRVVVGMGRVPGTDTARDVTMTEVAIPASGGRDFRLNAPIGQPPPPPQQPPP